MDSVYIAAILLLFEVSLLLSASWFQAGAFFVAFSE